MASATHIHARCPNPKCRREYRVKAEFIGKTATCKGCCTKFVLAVENNAAISAGIGRSPAIPAISSAASLPRSFPPEILKGFTRVGLAKPVEMSHSLSRTYTDVLRDSEEIASSISFEPMHEHQCAQVRESLSACFGTVEYKHIHTSIRRRLLAFSCALLAFVVGQILFLPMMMGFFGNTRSEPGAGQVLAEIMSVILAIGVHYYVTQYRRAKRLTPDRPSFGRRLLNVPRAFSKFVDRFVNPHGLGARPDGVPEAFPSKNDRVLLIREPQRTLFVIPRQKSRNAPGGLFGSQAKENYFDCRNHVSHLGNRSPLLRYPVQACQASYARPAVIRTQIVECTPRIFQIRGSLRQPAWTGRTT